MSGHGVGSPDYVERFVTEHIQPLASTSDVVVVRGSSSQEINDLIEEVMVEGHYSGVDGLYVLSHGNGGYIPNRKIDEPEKPSAYHSNLYNEGGGFLINLTDRKSVVEAFGNIVGRFNPQAHIIIDACKTIADGSDEVKLARMESVATAFGLEEGALYMSDINDMAFTDLYIRTPYYAERSSLLNNFSSFMVQSFSGITYPVGIGIELLLRNSGYTMVRNSTESQLYTDTLHHARTQTAPSGDPVAINAFETTE
jgi:hypothetical protein